MPDDQLTAEQALAPHRATRALISLDNLLENFHQIKKRAGDAKICAVVKADAYGHGFECIRMLQEEGADCLAVAFLEEAITLRKQGITNIPILLLGHTFADRAEELLEWHITPTVYQYDFAKALSDEAVARGEVHPVHIKLETGMGRIGIDWKHAAEDIKKIAELPGLRIEGLFTHFATADAKDKTFTHTQLARYAQVVKALDESGLHIPVKHVENSAAIIDFDTTVFDMVRPGIILYGMYPSDEVKKERLPLKPVMRFMTKITHLKTLEPGDTVGYGRAYTADQPRLAATLAAGYADGWSRMLSGKGTQVCIRGVRCPVLGNICMDQCVVDVSDVPGVQVGDDAELFGEQIPAEEIAQRLGTIPYEVTCMVNKRVPRIYTFMGEASMDAAEEDFAEADLFSELF